ASGVWRTEYDDADNRTATIDPTGARVEYEHDDLDRLRTRRELVRQPSPITAETHLDYDDLGNQTYFSDPEGVTTAATFDAASRRHTVEDALNKVISFEFDVAGRPTAVVDPLGR